MGGKWPESSEIVNISLASFSDGYKAAINDIGNYIQTHSPTGNSLGELRQLQDFMQKRKDRVNIEFILEIITLMHKMDNPL